MWWKIMAISIIVLAVVIAGVILYGVKRWQASTRELRAQIEGAQSSLTPKTYSSRELENLPLPVQRYFRAVLKEGQPLITAASIKHTGTFNMSESGEQWRPFESTQRVITRRPGFVWDARIQMAPAMPAFVHDAYVAGKGVLTAKLFGLITVMEQPATPELAQGELLRFFAEAVWYPTALLPSQGMVWEPINDSQAHATLTDGETTVTLLFHFNEQGLIDTVRAEGRYRDVGGEQIATPWQGRFWDYALRDGILIPLSGEVEWLPKEGPHPYWRGHIQQISYEYAQ
jgi:hypothetical protein